MSSEIPRKPNESFDAFLRRTKRDWRSSGKLLQVKKVRYFDEPKSKNLRKQQKVTHLAMKAKEAYLRKIGKLPEEETRYGNQR